MTPVRYKSALDAQPAIARKIFESVPIQEAWPVNKIIGAMIRMGIPRIDLKTAEGCLNKLKDASLVKEPDRGIFQRIVPREHHEPPRENREQPRDLLRVVDSGRASVADIEAHPVDPAIAPPTVVLGELATTLRKRADALDTLAICFRHEADTLDESALEFEDRIEAVEKRLSRFRELSAFLKEF